MVDKTNEFKSSKSDLEQAYIKQLLDKELSLKVIQYVISIVNTCEHKMIDIEKMEN